MMTMPCVPRFLRRCVAAAMLMPALASIAQAPARRIAAQPAATAARMALPNSVTSRPAHAAILGHLAGDTQLNGMALVIKPSATQQAALDQLLQDQQNPSSPSYHQWLTPAQFGARFGLADEDLTIVQNWLTASGFQVDEVAPSRNRIVFSGTAATVEAAFATTMQRYHLGDQTFFENSAGLQLPAALVPVISGFSGLSSYHIAPPQQQRLPVTPAYTNSAGTAHYLVPWDIRQIYGINTLLAQGFDGTGIKIGVLGQSSVQAAQLTFFQQKTGQTVKAPTMVLVPHTGTAGLVSGDEGESELDLEYASGTAPGATVLFIYTGQGNDVNGTNGQNNGVFDSMSYAVTNNLAPILTLSYGACENDADNASYISTVAEPILQQGASQGQTIFVSSGDFGATSCETSSAPKVATGGLSVSYPASSAYVTGVGGTQLNSDTAWSSTNNSFAGSATGYMPEIAWNDTAAYGSLSVSGGGVSSIFSKPTWQAGTGVPADGKRDVPDISLPASVNVHAYIVCSVGALCTDSTVGFATGGGGRVGGTSAAAPNLAAMFAVIEQANGGGALGLINPRLYTLAASASASSIFHDITSGNNIVPCVGGTLGCSSTVSTVNGTMGYTAGTGYDLVTGLGSVDATALRTAFGAVTAKTPLLALASSATASTPGTAVTFTLTVSGSNGTATGTANFSINGGAAVPVTLASGKATYTYTPTTPGSVTLTASYLGDTNYNTGSASLTFGVTQITPTVAVTASSTTVPQSTAVRFTATVTGNGTLTPTGTATFLVDGSPVATGVALSSGTATLNYTGFATAGAHTLSASYSGDTAYANVTSSAINITVTAATATLTPTVSLTGTSTSVAAGATLPIVVNVTGTGATPTGTVNFSLTGSTGFNGTLSAGRYTTNTTIGTAGTYTLTAIYSGDSNYLPATTTLTITVTAPSFTLSFAPSTVTVVSGADGAGTVTATSVNNFAGTVSFKYSVTPVSGVAFAGCLAVSGSTSTATVTAGGTGTLPLVIRTTAAKCTTASALPATTATTPLSLISRSGAAFLSVAGLFGCFFFRKRVRPGILLAILFLAMTTGLSGCGGASGSTSSSTGSSGTGSGSTTASTSLITLSGTSGTVTATTTFTVVIQ